MKKINFVFIIAIIIYVLFSCSPMPMSRAGNLATTLTFTLPIEDSRSTKTVLSGIEATHIGIMSLGGYSGWQWNAYVEYIPLSVSRDIEVSLPKDRIYAISVYGLNEEGRLVSIAPIKPGVFDLDTFPMSEGCSDLIDLGEVLASPVGYVSQLSEQGTSDALGYQTETLRDFGAFDNQLIRLKNPDANGDSLIDYEQGIFWELWLSNDYRFKTGAATLSPDLNLMVDSFLELERVTIGFWTIEPFEQTDFTSYDLRLELPFTVTDEFAIDTDYLLSGFFGPTTNCNGNVFTHLDWMVDFFGAEPGQGAFAHFDVLSYTPQGPWADNYIMHIGEKQYWIDDVDFFSPEDKLVDIPFPLYELKYNESNHPLSLKWSWYRIDNDTIVPADPDFVRLMIATFIPQFSYDVEFSAIENWWEGGSIENAASFSDIDLTEDFFSFYIRDLRGNTFHFRIPETNL